MWFAENLGVLNDKRCKKSANVVDVAKTYYALFRKSANVVGVAKTYYTLLKIHF